MATLDSKVSLLRGVSVVDLCIEDLNKEKLCYAFCKKIDATGSQQVVIDLTLVDVIVRADLEKLTALNTGLKMMGRKVMFCGLNPYTAAVLLTFDAEVSINTELDVDHAIEALSYSSEY